MLFLRCRCRRIALLCASTAIETVCSRGASCSFLFDAMGEPGRRRQLLVLSLVPTLLVLSSVIAPRPLSPAPLRLKYDDGVPPSSPYHHDDRGSAAWTGDDCAPGWTVDPKI